MKARCLYKLGKMDQAKQSVKLVLSHPWPTDYYPKHVIERLESIAKKLDSKI